MPRSLPQLFALGLCTLAAGCDLVQYAPDAPVASVQARARTTIAGSAAPAAATTPAPRPVMPVGRDQVMASALDTLHAIGAEMSPQIAGCTRLPLEVTAFISTVASRAKLLRVRLGAGATTRDVAQLAADLSLRSRDVSKRTPSAEELRRIQLELAAAARDIAETLELFADKLAGDDTTGLQQVRARLRNAAGNYVTSVRTLVGECTAG